MPKLSKTVDDFGFLLYCVINKWIHYHISNIGLNFADFLPVCPPSTNVLLSISGINLYPTNVIYKIDLIYMKDTVLKTEMEKLYEIICEAIR